MVTFACLIVLTAVLAIGPCPDTTKETCLRGGMAAYPCSGKACPPCWIPQDATTWGCYEKLAGPDNSTACPAWPGMVDTTKPCPVPAKPIAKMAGRIRCPNAAVETCYAGGNKDFPCTGASCAPCWEYKNDNWACWAPFKFVCSGENQLDIRNLPANCDFAA